MRKLDILKKAVVAVAVVAMGAFAAPVMASDLSIDEGIQGGINDAGGADNTGPSDLGSVVTTVINVILWAVGLLSVAFIIYGGVKYAMSAGDSAKVKSAKDTLMYAIIGLIVAILAYAIVNFVIDAFK